MGIFRDLRDFPKCSLAFATHIFWNPQHHSTQDQDESTEQNYSRVFSEQFSRLKTVKILYTLPLWSTFGTIQQCLHCPSTVPVIRLQQANTTSSQSTHTLGGHYYFWHPCSPRTVLITRNFSILDGSQASKVVFMTGIPPPSQNSVQHLGHTFQATRPSNTIPSSYWSQYVFQT